MEGLNSARQLSRTGRYREALTALNGVRAVSEHQEIETLRTFLLSQLGLHSECKKTAERVLKTRNLSPSRRSICEYSLGWVDRDEGLTDSAIERFQRAASCARQAGDLEQLCLNQMSLWFLLACRENAESSTPLLAEVRSNAIKLGDAHVLANLHLFVAQVEGQRGLLNSAVRHARAAQNILSAHPNVWLDLISENVLFARALAATDLDA